MTSHRRRHDVILAPNAHWARWQGTPPFFPTIFCERKHILWLPVCFSVQHCPFKMESNGVNSLLSECAVFSSWPVHPPPRTPPIEEGSKTETNTAAYVVCPLGRQFLWKEEKGWMDGWLAILRPFQQYFSHISTVGGWKWKTVCNGTPFTNEKILAWREARTWDR